jgi:hypothetical protein
MSSRSYAVVFADARAERAVRRTVVNVARREVPEWRRRLLARMEWVGTPEPAFAVPDGVLEFDVPDEWTAADGIKREKMLVSATGDGLSLTISDGNLRGDRCEELVRRFVRELYRKATGKVLAEKEIEVSSVAVLRHYACECCGERITGLPYSCSACGRCFCYDHRRPESHGCARCERSRGKSISRSGSARAAPQRGSKPVVLIRKVPCG